MDEEVEVDPRVMDLGRGPFCAVTKSGLPLPLPPTKREPIANKEKNPKGVRHPFKTQQDQMPRDKRPRVEAAKKRRERMQG